MHYSFTKKTKIVPNKLIYLCIIKNYLAQVKIKSQYIINIYIRTLLNFYLRESIKWKLKRRI